MTIKVTYNVTDVYVSETVSATYINVSYETPTNGGAVWGDITGTLSNQLDLQAALDAKYDDPTGTTAQYIRGDGTLATFPTITSGTVTSVGLTMPTAFNVANSPITSSGTLAVTGAGTAAQYIRGDGQLATFPSSAGGGSSVNYYLNGSVNASVASYKQMDNTAIVGGGTDFTLVGNGLIAQFLTNVGNPNRIQIPGGAWNFEMFFQVSSSGGNQKFYVELHKYDGSTFTLIASSLTVPEEITGGTSIDLYLTSLAVPTTTLLATDRLAIRVYIVDNAVGRTVTLHTENNTLCEIITTFAGGVASLNGLTANTQYLATGTSGTDFNISSLTDTHTFNLPTASATNRGALSTADWSAFNSKIGGTGASGQVAYFTGANTQTGSNNFFWDNTNGRLGIGTNTPTFKLDVIGDASINGVNIGIGGGSITTNTRAGLNTLNANTTGFNNTAVGLSALLNNTTGSNNVAIGASALQNNTTANSNTAVGRNTLSFNTTGIENTAIGLSALQGNSTGFNNTAIGVNALFGNTTGENNTAIGKSALSANTTGVLNTAIGQQTLGSNTTGGSNAAYGRNALFNNTTGDNNVGIGVDSGRGATPNTTGSNNIFIGRLAVGVSSTESNRTWIGNSDTTSTWLGGNLLLGSTTNGTQRLQVTGDTLLKGSGNTSATTALTVQNSAGTNIFRVRNNGEFLFGNSSSFVWAWNYSTDYNSADLNGKNFAIYPIDGAINLGGGTQAATSGASNNIITKGRYQPTSGTGTFTEIRSEAFINQTGGANGITRGLYVNPTLTAAADWRAIEALGKVIFTGETLTGSRADSLLSVSQTYNTTGSPALIYGNLTNTASGSNTSLLRLDISSSSVFTISPSGLLKFGAPATSGSGIAAVNPTDGTGLVNGLSLAFYMSGGTQTGYDFYFRNFSGTRSATSGTNGSIRTLVQFNPTSGTGTYDIISIGNTINQVGATGITRGLYVNANLVAAADWRSIEWSNNTGWGLYGAGTANNLLNGNLGIGVTPTQLLHVAKNQNASTQILVANSDATNTSSRATFQATNGVVSARLDTIGATGTYLGAYIGTITNHNLYFWTNGQERGFFTATGNLILGTIGTTDTTEKLQVNGTMKVTGASTFSSSVTASQLRLSALNTAPATSSSTGTLGEIRIDADNIYICTATNTWKRVAIATF